jgi:NADPH:quinone reductase
MTRAIQIHEIGGPEVLKMSEVVIGSPGPGEVRIDHTAIGVNFIDIYHRTGLYPQPMPFIPGMEGAGIVGAIGPGVTGLNVGDRVGYAGLIGSYSEARLVRADRLVVLPDHIPDELAAAIMLKGMTAQVLLRQVYKVAKGDTILIHAAAGGLGTIMCQWAASLGATVIGTVSSDEKAQKAKANGCQYPIVYTRENFVERVNEITEGRKVPVVYDSVGKVTFSGSLDCLRPRGLLVISGSSSGPVPSIDPSLLAQKGSLFLTRSVVFTYISTRAELEAAAADLFSVVAAGKIKIPPNQRYPLAEAERAHRDLENRRTMGATVLCV